MEAKIGMLGVINNLGKRTYSHNAGWDYMLKHGNTGDWFFNVAGNADIPKIDKSSIDSYRDWRDYRDFKNIL